MNWLEIIHLRITSPDNAQVMQTALELTAEAQTDEPHLKISLLKRGKIDTDISILLYHDAKTSYESEGSALGICIASALRSYGMVHHMVWQEMHSAQ